MIHPLTPQPEEEVIPSSVQPGHLTLLTLGCNFSLYLTIFTRLTASGKKK